MKQQPVSVVRFGDIDSAPLAAMLSRYGLQLRQAADEEDIAGSFWGDEEAGLLGNMLVLRSDTPLHSILHEACHFICMDPGRREGLDTDAGGGYEEENAVCYLQILLADEIPSLGRDRMMQDMDAWGYSFRLGSARAWFEGDAEDARAWLLEHELISEELGPAFRLRSEA